MNISLDNFNDTINPMSKCGADTETITHYLLCCRLYSVQRAELLNDLSVTISSFVWF